MTPESRAELEEVLVVLGNAVADDFISLASVIAAGGIPDVETTSERLKHEHVPKALASIEKIIIRERVDENRLEIESAINFLNHIGDATIKAIILPYFTGRLAELQSKLERKS